MFDSKEKLYFKKFDEKIKQKGIAEDKKHYTIVNSLEQLKSNLQQLMMKTDEEILSGWHTPKINRNNFKDDSVYKKICNIKNSGDPRSSTLHYAVLCLFESREMKEDLYSLIDGLSELDLLSRVSVSKEISPNTLAPYNGDFLFETLTAPPTFENTQSFLDHMKKYFGGN